MLPIKRLVIENSICWEYKSWSDIEYCPVSNVKVNKFQICHLDPALWELNVDSFVMDRIQHGTFCHHSKWRGLGQNRN